MKKIKEIIKQIINKNKKEIINYLIILLIFLITYIVMSLLNEMEIKSIFNFKNFILNYLIILAIFFIIKGITGKIKIASIITIYLFFIFEIINYIVTQVRGISVTISDIYSIKTAISVAKGIKLKLNINFYISVILFISTVILINLLKIKKENKIKRIINLILGTVIILIIFNLPYLNKIGIWDINDCYKNYGSGLTILRMAKDLKINKPKEYNKKEIKELLETYKEEKCIQQNDVNIIVIMNESFADLNKIYKLSLKQDNIPFFHSLEKETKIGKMHSSQYGGGTANVEYEFLTQNTTAFLPVGATPYQQYIKRNATSIVSQMNKLNYTTYGIHSWYKTSYSRGKIYKYFGFNNVKFKEDIQDLAYEYNEYPSDLSTYQELINKLENKEQNEKIFSFVLTMQNHLPYIHEQPNGIQYVKDDIILNNYLQIQHKADEALEIFINYLKNKNEKTIVLFFGDHQPNLELSEKYQLRDGYSGENKDYIVPFFIWTNYEESLDYPDETSTNYLQSILLKNAKLPKDSYTKYIEELQENIPVITTQYYIDRDGNKYKIDDSTSPYYYKVKEYENIVYYKIFDE